MPPDFLYFGAKSLTFGKLKLAVAQYIPSLLAQAYKGMYSMLGVMLTKLSRSV